MKGKAKIIKMSNNSLYLLLEQSTKENTVNMSAHW